MKRVVILLLLALGLQGCFSPRSSDGATSTGASILKQDISGAKVGTIVSLLMQKIPESPSQTRPSAVIGTYISMFLSQGVFLPVQGALEGIATQQSLLKGQMDIEASETFALLKEFGAALQVDLIDLLNRSDNRVTTLDAYVASLNNIMKLANRKINELETRKDAFKDESKEKRKLLRDKERALNAALRDEDYEIASVLQEEVTKASSSVAEVEVQEGQVADVLDTYEDLLGVGQERMDAIIKNRRIILAGLKVVDVPGIKDFDILEKKRLRKRNSGGGEGIDPLVMFGL